MDLTYTLIRSARRKKTLSLTVRPSGDIALHAPRCTPQAAIDAFFQEKTPWLKQALEKMHRQQVPIKAITDPGRTFLYLGRAYPLMLTHHASSPELLTLAANAFTLDARFVRRAPALFQAWHTQRAREHLPGRLKHFATRLGVESPPWRISNPRSRWGSCSPENRLSFSWRLMMAAPEVIDYIIVHELCHLREKNHAPSFWILVSRLLPDFDRSRRWLRENGHTLTI